MMKTVKANLHKSLLAAALTGILAASSPAAMAAVFADFGFDPNYDGDTSDKVIADKIVGGYTEAIVFSAVDATSGTFDVKLRWTAGQYFSADGTNSLTANTTRLGVDYGLYALYEGSGTYSIVGGVTTFTTTANVGNFQLYLDPYSPETTFANIGNAVTFANIFDLTVGTAADPDRLVATGTPQAGTGTLDPSLPTCTTSGPINCGSFGTSVDFALTPFGMDYFVDPVPFYNFSFQAGQLNNFEVAGEQIINGSMDVVFQQVPEPGTLALLGLSLVGLGVARQRRVS